jgi:hypothetical protein
MILKVVDTFGFFNSEILRGNRKMAIPLYAGGTALLQMSLEVIQYYLA